MIHLVHNTLTFIKCLVPAVLPNRANHQCFGGFSLFAQEERRAAPIRGKVWLNSCHQIWLLSMQM